MYSMRTGIDKLPESLNTNPAPKDAISLGHVACKIQTSDLASTVRTRA
jgi:hypothetical protein